MNHKAFTLMELMVGLLIALMLTAAMATFLGNAAYTFQEHKAVLRDRSQLQQALVTLTRDLMFIGQSADESGLFKLDGVDTPYLNISSDGDAFLGTSLTYYRVLEDMDYAASVTGEKEYNWLPVTYEVNKDALDPVTREPLTILLRNDEPFLLGVTAFSVAFGVDDNDDGLIDEEEWVNDIPANPEAVGELVGGVTVLRISLGINTPLPDGRTIDSLLVRDIKLRNRS